MSFERDITLRPIGEDSGSGAHRFAAEITHDWFIIAGPNGGFIAALLLRAMDMTQADAARAARSLSVDYFAPPKIGAAQIETAIIRRGKNLTAISAAMRQEGRLNAQAIAAFATDYPAKIAIAPKAPPSPRPFDDAPIMPDILPIHDRLELRPAFGTMPFTSGKHAISGGWTRLQQRPRNVSAELLALISDCWPPAIFSVMSQAQAIESRGLPTIELSIYFLQPHLYPTLDPAAPVLARFETPEICQGFLTEDGNIWTQDGQMLARSRQIAIMR